MRLTAPIAAWLAAAIIVVAPASADEPAAPSPRATMHEVFDALARLLPASLEAGRLADPARRDEFQLAFEELARASAMLAAHGNPGDEAFRLFARSLATDADYAAGRFARGRLDEAADRVILLTQRCVGCHARLPAAREFPLADRLLGKIDLQQLPAEDRAALLVATRRFGDALAAWESLFADPTMPPFALDQDGALVDYLTIALRVENDLPRAQRALTALAARPDTPRPLRSRLVGWSDALRALAAPPQATPPLERAALLAERARGLAEFPFEGDGLVLDLYASGLLLQEVARRTGEGTTRSPDPELARAFWLLGVLEERITVPLRLPETEAYLEAALRAAPSGPLAARAYERIERTVLVDLGAMQTADLPEAERTRLAELRRLVEARPDATAADPAPPPGRTPSPR